MCRQDAVKARIKKLEDDMLGLMYRLERLDPPISFSSMTGNFNGQSRRAPLLGLFTDAIRLKDCLRQQISSICEELHELQSSSPSEYDLTLAA